MITDNWEDDWEIWPHLGGLPELDGECRVSEPFSLHGGSRFITCRLIWAGNAVYLVPEDWLDEHHPGWREIS